MASSPKLGRIELTFRTTDDVGALADRIREAVRTIVGRDALEEFRVRTLPLVERKRDHLHPVD